MTTTHLNVNGKDTPVSELSSELQSHLKEADAFYVELELLEKQVEISGDMTPLKEFLESHPFNQIN